MLDYDLIVVGAGASGSITAWTVAKLGYDVLLVDRLKSKAIGHPWQNGVERGAFSALGIPEPQPPELLTAPKRIRFTSHSGKLVADFPNPMYDYTLNQQLLDKRLLEYAIDEGARLMDESEAIDLVIKDNSVKGVRLHNKKDAEFEVRAKMVVDATGFAGALRKMTPSSFEIQHEIDESDTVNAVVFIHQVDINRLKNASQALNLELDVCTIRLGHNGAFSALTLQSEGNIVILIGARNLPGYAEAKDTAAELIEEHDFIGKRLLGGGGNISIRRPLPKMVADGFALVGEAASMVVPLMGSGVGSGMRAGNILGKVIVSGLMEDNLSTEKLWEYNREFMRTRGAILASQDVIRLALQNRSPMEQEDVLDSMMTTPRIFHASMALKQAKPGVKEILYGLYGAISSPVKTMPLIRASLDANRAYNLYRNFPRFYSPARFHNWRRLEKKIFESYESK